MVGVMKDITINGIFAISGVVGGGTIGFATAWFANWYLLKKKAASELRSSFVNILSGIRTGKLSSTTEIGNRAVASFDAHAIELERFRFYVPNSQKEEYDKACEEYQDMVYARPINHGSNLSADKFYMKKLGAILKHAKP